MSMPGLFLSVVRASRSLQFLRAADAGWESSREHLCATVASALRRGNRSYLWLLVVPKAGSARESV